MRSSGWDDLEDQTHGRVAGRELSEGPDQRSAHSSLSWPEWPAGSLGGQCRNSRRAQGCATSCHQNRRVGGSSSPSSPDVVESAGYGQVISPMLEDLGVFQRIGDATDVVTKEMYDFVDKGGRHVALAPGADRVGVQGVRAAPAADAVEGVVRGLAVPLREAAAWPLPAVRPGRHRGARRRRSIPRRRGDRPRLGVLSGARPEPGHSCC